MGRKKDWKELGTRGPGRKARKQQAPVLPPHLKEEEPALGVKRVGGRIKQRGKKRALKEAVRAMEAERKKKVKKGKKETKNKEEGKLPWRCN